MILSVFMAGITLSIMQATTAMAEEQTEECNHEYVSQTVQPTCTEKGYDLHVCSLCGDERKDAFTNEVGHEYSSVTVEPTCKDRGYTTHFCNVCGYEYTDSYVEAKGHEYQAILTRAPRLPPRGGSARRRWGSLQTWAFSLPQTHRQTQI